MIVGWRWIEAARFGKSQDPSAKFQRSFPALRWRALPSPLGVLARLAVLFYDEVDPEKALVIREVFERIAAGKTAAEAGEHRSGGRRRRAS